ncbi:hypothetical protein M569_05214, partial [Genlisea aurea]
VKENLEFLGQQGFKVNEQVIQTLTKQIIDKYEFSQSERKKEQELSTELTRFIDNLTQQTHTLHLWNATDKDNTKKIKNINELINQVESKLKEIDLTYSEAGVVPEKITGLVESCSEKINLIQEKLVECVQVSLKSYQQ